ncbi:helix-turn-helix transcriptional regulator [Neisseria sp. Dent CA1/247]|uniref:LexA family transcriptional regulator n=1 Tax=Neisseria sp. Dent CA1/247 TaxID=2912675 RepID=UPI001FD55B63|nr:helix-turn-helix transcriptional regulator [Neisseria sp. Dent CA1/247]UOO77355.1 helix-turn-helix transcriptional regulator [Neisseria sp. Dent CA1/247]
MDSFKDRLIYLWRDNPKPTIIARDIGMSTPGFSRIWYNDGLPNTETLIKIQESTGCNLNWLLTGKGEPYEKERAGVSKTPTKEPDNPIVLDTLGNPVNLEEFVFIPRYDINASAGNGFPIDTENPLFCMAFRRYWIENYVTTQIEKLSVITVKGDSMEGVLNHGDNILVNHADTNPRDGLYVLRVNNDLIVKRVQALPGRLLVKSANPEYEPFEINLNHEQQDVAIIGRVEWFGRTIN